MRVGAGKRHAMSRRQGQWYELGGASSEARRAASRCESTPASDTRCRVGKDSGMSLLEVSGLRKRFGGLAATDGVDLTVDAGEVHAVIGPNGAGKTTLINQLSGEIGPDAGTIRFDGNDITREHVYRRALAGIGRSYQITSVFH